VGATSVIVRSVGDDLSRYECGHADRDHAADAMPFSTMAMVVLTEPLGLAGVVPMLLTFHQPFGFNAIPSRAKA